MGVVEAIKKGFGAAAKNVGLIGVLFVFNVVMNLVSLPFAQTAASPNPQFTATTLLISLVFILISIFLQGGSLGIVRDYLKQGKSELSKLVSYGSKYYLRLFLLGALIVAVIFVAGIIAALIIAATAPLNNAAVTIIAAIIAIIIGVIALFYIFLLIFSPYVLVCEDKGVIDALKASIKIVRGAILKTLLLLVMIILIAFGIGFLVGFLTGLITVMMPVSVGQVVIAVISSLFNAYLGLVMMATFMIFYFAQKEKSVA